MSSTTHREISTTTDEENHLMDRITDTAEDLFLVDVCPRQRVNQRVLGLLFATFRLAFAGFLVWAAVHLFQDGQLPALLDANGRWAWFGAGAFALFLLNETGEALTWFGESWGRLRLTLWQASTAKALPPGERLRLISADELARLRTNWPSAPAGIRTGEPR